MEFTNTIKRLKKYIKKPRTKKSKPTLYLMILMPILFNSLASIGLLRYYFTQNNTNSFVSSYTKEKFERSSKLRLDQLLLPSKNNAELKTEKKAVLENTLGSQHRFYYLAIAILGLVTYLSTVWLIVNQNSSKSKDIQLKNYQDSLEKKADLEANQEAYALLANMSHELRSPLNAILGFVQIMEQELSIPPASRDNIAIIHRSGDRLLSIINDVIDLAKIETSRLTLEQNSIDLYSWLDSLERSLKFQARNQNWELRLIKGDNLPRYINIDESRLEQIVKNLVNCCLKPTSTVEIDQVSLRVSCDQVVRDINIAEDPDELSTKNICFVVENPRFTVLEAELTTLFDPIITVKQEQQSTRGSSLNLPISRKLAQLMGGDISVDGKSNLEGITFNLNIRAEIIVDPNMPVQSGIKKVVGLKSDQTEYRILVVDDSKTNRKIMLGLLEPLGFKVQEAVNGQEAVDIWLRWQPHMIWMDLKMPVMDGHEATERIKSYSKTNQISSYTPIVALSASTLEEDKSLFKRAGCDDFVGKPFSENVIFDKIAQHLGIQYIYESVKPSEYSDFKLTADALSVMPEEWLNRLESAATFLDRDLLTQLLEDIPIEHSELKKALQTQINNFEFDRILSLTGNKRKSNQHN